MGSEQHEYAAYLAAAQTGWRKWIDVQAPYRLNIQRLRLGYTLDVGCGVGRNLSYLGGVGLDVNAHCVRIARERGLRAFTPDEFARSPFASEGAFDSLLCSHVVEHMSRTQARSLLQTYLPYVKQGGRVVVIVPQRAGFASDSTHVHFFTTEDVSRLFSELSVNVRSQRSFPFPSRVGDVFKHNEWVTVGIKP